MNRARSNRGNRNVCSQQYSTTEHRLENRNYSSQPQPGTSLRQSQTNAAEKRLSEMTIKLEKNIASQEERQLVSEVVEYIIMEDSAKKPIMKSRIVKCALGSRAKEFNKIMPKVKASLLKVFGYKLIELDNNKYIIVNNIANSQNHIRFSKSERPQLVLLFIILAHIFMLDDCCTEDALWSFLKHLGIISENNFYHPYFGNVKQLITEDFLTQRYLNRTVLEWGEPPKYEYKWGPRAEHELSRRTIMQFVSEVYNGRPLNTWPLQYKALLDKEKIAAAQNRRGSS